MSFLQISTSQIIKQLSKVMKVITRTLVNEE